MSLPQILQRFNTFIDGDTFIGETESVELPKLGRVMEAFRAGGMGGPIDLDMGNEAIEATITMAGVVRRALSGYAQPRADGTQLRFVGAYRSGSTAAPQAVEAVLRGRYKEVELGAQKAGDKGEHKIKFTATYYKLVIDGQTMIEIDLINGKTVVDGVDRDLEMRALIGQ